MVVNKIPYIIAEIANAHDGNYNLALKIAQSAISSGSDAIKFQIFNRSELLTKTNKFNDLFKSIEISTDEWYEILNKISKSTIDILVEVFDITSFKFAENTGFVNAYKIPASSIVDYDLLKNIGETNKPIFLGIGGATWEEIVSSLNYLKKITPSDIILICGFQNFPTFLENSNLFQIASLKKKFKCEVGYADHVDADNIEMAKFIPGLAYSLGASVIEKHITDDRSRKGTDYYSSLNPEEFSEFVNFIRQLPGIIGNGGKWELTDSELKYRNYTLKKAVASKYIPANSKFDVNNVVFKRTNESGLSALQIKKYDKKKLYRSKNIDEAFLMDDFIKK
jgi:N,N'-diacetyllegionaminate synthase